MDRRFRSDVVLLCLAELFTDCGPPDHIHADNGSEFATRAVHDWLTRIGVRTLYIVPGSPWEKGSNESFNGKLRDELLNRAIFYTLAELGTLIESWQRHYYTVWPHLSLGYRRPAPQAILPKLKPPI